MANTKISALTSATTPLAGTETLPIVQSSATKQVSVANLTAGRAVSMLNGTATDFLLVGNSAGAKYARIQSTGNGAQVNLDIYGKTGGGADAGFSIGIGITGDKGLEFQDNATGVVRAELAQAGNLKLNSGNLVIGTSGKGIDFSATAGTGTSELLADYEEGTWTPIVTAVTGSYTTVSNENGTYTKIGRQVTVRGFFIVDNKGTGSGGANVAGLPFTSAATRFAGSGYDTSSAAAYTLYMSGSAATSFEIYKYDGTDPIVAGRGNVFELTYFV